MPALALVFFAALSLNLLVSFALGIRELVMRERTPVYHIYYPWFLLFVSTLLLWLFFTGILFFAGGTLNLILCFPLSVIGTMGLEILFFRILALVKNITGSGKFFRNFNPGENPGVFSPGSSYNGLAAAALFLTLRFAVSFTDALLLSFAFSAGGLLAFLIVKEIQKRSFLETIPYQLRGAPILLVSMGLLSVVFSAASVLFLKIFL